MGVREIELRDIGSVRLLVYLYLYERQRMKNKDTVFLYRFPLLCDPQLFSIPHNS